MPNKFKLNPTGAEADSLFRNGWAIDITSQNTGGGPSATTGFYNGAAVPAGGWVIYTPAGRQFSASTVTQFLEFTASVEGDSSSFANALVWLSDNSYLVLDADIRPTITDGLIVHLDGMNSASFDGADWYDLSGQNNHARLMAGTAARADGGGVVFDGSTYYQIAKSASMDSWAEAQTIAIWMKHSFTSGRRNPWDQAYGGYGTWTHESGNNINCFFGDAGSNTQPYTSANSGTTNRNVWNLMVTSRDNNTLRWYNNATLTGTRSHSYGTLTGTNANVRIGLGYAGWWIGEMALVQAWNRALTAEEIAQIWSDSAPA